MVTKYARDVSRGDRRVIEIDCMYLRVPSPKRYEYGVISVEGFLSYILGVSGYLVKYYSLPSPSSSLVETVINTDALQAMRAGHRNHKIIAPTVRGARRVVIFPRTCT